VLHRLVAKERDLATLQWLNRTMSEHGSTLLENPSIQPEMVTFTDSIERQISETDPSADIFVPLTGIAKALRIDVLPDGEMVVAVVHDGMSRLEVMDAYGLPDKLTAHFESFDTEQKSQPAVSRSGLKLAYVVHRSDVPEVRIIDRVGQKRIDLFEGEYQPTRRPSWSPNGLQLVFVKGRGEQSGIYTIGIETKEEKQLTQGGTDDRPCWSPHAERIAFQRTVNQVTQIYIMNPDGSEQIAVTAGPNDVEPSWSWDGSRILFARRAPSDSPGFYEVNALSGGNETLLLADVNPHSPTWLIDGQILLCQSDEEASGAIYRYNILSGKKKKIANGIDPSWHGDRVPSRTT
jgi:Tol biopolymer transport system component